MITPFQNYISPSTFEIEISNFHFDKFIFFIKQNMQEKIVTYTHPVFGEKFLMSKFTYIVKDIKNLKFYMLKLITMNEKFKIHIPSVPRENKFWYLGDLISISRVKYLYRINVLSPCLPWNVIEEIVETNYNL